jgi:curved DNA-binding protein CbpA
MLNYYQLFGVNENATKKEIDKAYKRRIAEWEKEGEQNMQEYLDIEAAHKNLTDELLREWHDAELNKKRAIKAEPPAYYSPPPRRGYRHTGFKKMTGWAALLVAAKLLHMFHFLLPSDNNTPNYTIHFTDTTKGTADSFLQKQKTDSVLILSGKPKAGN